MEHHDIEITARDRVMRAWLNSMELVRDYQAYAKDIGDKKAAEMFSEYAEEEAVHASELHEMLKKI